MERKHRSFSDEFDGYGMVGFGLGLGSGLGLAFSTLMHFTPERFTVLPCRKRKKKKANINESFLCLAEFQATS